MSTPRVLFVDGDGDLPRGIAPVPTGQRNGTDGRIGGAADSLADGGTALEFIAFDQMPSPRSSPDGLSLASATGSDDVDDLVGSTDHAGTDVAPLRVVADRHPGSRSAADHHRRPAWVMWRLLSGNNRELGRGASAFADLDGAVAAVLTLRAGLAHVESRILREPRPGHWVWFLEVEGAPVARSARSYQRLRECEYSLAGFLEALPLAQLQADPERVVHQRRPHAAAVEPLPAPSVEVR
jgi:hypothetical protein